MPLLVHCFVPMPLSFLLHLARCALVRMHQNVLPTMPCLHLNNTGVRQRCQENLSWNRVRKCDVMKDYVVILSGYAFSILSF